MQKSLPLVIHPNTGGEFDVSAFLRTTTGSVTTYANAVAPLQANGSLDTGFGANAGIRSYFAPYGNNNTSATFGRLGLQSVLPGNLERNEDGWRLLK